jgi:branched-chain amino acid aminotransferase
MTSQVWVNGTVLEQSEALVSAFDHGFTVGDGVFETTKVVDGVPYALTRHLDRLARGARGLGLPDPDLALVRHAIEDTLAENDTSAPLRLRLTYTGGVSPLGSDRGSAGPTLVVAVAPVKDWPETAALATVPWPRNERAATAGLKTTSYADNVIALARAKAQGADEAVFANTRGELCEGTGSNVFVVLGDRLVTPPLSSGCLAGVTRSLVVEWLGVEEADLPVEVLGEADEVFLTSATRDVQGVHRVDDRQLPGAPGPVTREAAKVFAERSAAAVDP